MMRGEIPDDVRPWVCGGFPHGSSLTVRQWARRFVDSVARFVSNSWVAHYLGADPGRSVNEVCESVVHATRQWTHFHCVPRAVLSAVRTHFRWLALWADTCSRYDFDLLVGSSLISSQRGDQQGDPLDPSLFALALHPCVTAVARASASRFPGGLGCNSCFLGDGIFASVSSGSADLCRLCGASPPHWCHPCPS